MRWPFRRRGAAPAGPAAQPDRPLASPPERAAGAGTGRRVWQTLPPLVPVLAKPHLTVVRPPVSGARTLLHRPPAPTPADRPAGTVTGLAEVLPALDFSHPMPPPAAPRPVRAVTRPVPRAPLTAATAEYVGEARQPAQPHRAPAWLRALSSGPVIDPLFGAIAPPSSAAPPSWTPTTTHPGAAPRPVPAARRPLRPHGRVGLGAPLPESMPDGPTEAEPEPATPSLLTGPPGPATTTTSPSARAAAPADLTREVADATGMDLDGVLVHRGPDVDRRAVETGSAAYAVDDAVHLPSTAGDGEEARALLAHELVHVAQQRMFGAALPDEGSAEGAELEADAVAVEQAVRAGRPLPRLQHPRAVLARLPRFEAEPVRATPVLPVSRLVHRPGVPAADDGTTNAAGGPVVATHGHDEARTTAPIPGQAAPRTAGFDRPGVSGRASPPAAVPGESSPDDSGWDSARRSGAGRGDTTLRPIGVLGHPSGAAAAPERGVTGRVQRRPAALSHPRPAASATHPATASASTTGSGTSGGDAGSSSTTSTTAPTGWAGFGQALGNDLSDMVLSSWSLEEVRDTHRSGQGGGGGGDGSGGDSPEERFNRLAQPALERLNEQRLAAGQDQLVQLPPDEEARIWAQVNAGGGSGGGSGGHGHHDQHGIRNWGDFGTALGSDLTDTAVGWLGIDSAELLGAGTEHAAGGTTPAGSTGAAPAAAHAASPAAAHAASPAAGEHAEHAEHAERPSIDTDDLDLDELTTRLYDRIRSRLRLELLLDRERAGLLSDFR